jgi:hypothetical protein
MTTFVRPSLAPQPALPPRGNIETNITRVQVNTDREVSGYCGEPVHGFVIWNFGGILIEARRAP